MPLFASSSGQWQAAGPDTPTIHHRETGEDAVFLSTPSTNHSSTSHSPFRKRNNYYSNNNNNNSNNNNNHDNHSSYLDGYNCGGSHGEASGDTSTSSSALDGHHVTQQHGHFFQNIFSANSLMAEGHDHGFSNGSSLLAPPPAYPGDMGRRRSSSSSLDSYNNLQSHRRRGSHRGGSVSRLSDLDEDSGEAATLMTYVHGVGLVYKKARNVLRRLLQVVFVARPSRPKVVCEAEVMEQVSWVCKDYIVARLVARDLMSRKTGVTPSNWPPSRHVIAAGSILEVLYPRTYSNVSRKLCLTMSSPKVVRNTLMLLLEVLFEKSITWAKIVSMMAVAGLYAEECASQGHPDFVHEVVDVVLDFTGGHLLAWLVLQGGWDGFPLPEGDERNHLSKSRLLIVTGAITTLAVARYYLQII